MVNVKTSESWGKDWLMSNLPMRNFLKVTGALDEGPRHIDAKPLTRFMPFLKVTEFLNGNVCLRAFDSKNELIFENSLDFNGTKSTTSSRLKFKTISSVLNAEGRSRPLTLCPFSYQAADSRYEPVIELSNLAFNHFFNDTNLNTNNSNSISV